MSLIRGDARALPIADRTIQCVVTSPPYFGLRDYGTAGQMGLELTPDAYVAALVAVFREVRRVLKDDGVLWLNLGDSYAMTTRGAGGRGKQHTNKGSVLADRSWAIGSGLKAKDLIGIPWMVAFALRADGWYLRSDVIWSKPNPMPESVTDRPTKAHEYLFLLTKSARYRYSAAAIAEPAIEPAPRFDWTARKAKGEPIRQGQVGLSPAGMISGGIGGDGRTRNKRTVWTVVPRPYKGAHFAVMPEALVEPCILAGAPIGSRVLDPFVGSGTVVAVAERLGRIGVGVDLAYQDLARARIAAPPRKVAV